MSENEKTDDGGREWTQINVRLDPDTKTEWKESTGQGPEYEYRNVSQLVRRAVSKELRRRDTADTGGQADVAPVLDDEVLPALKRIESRLEELDARVQAVERDVEAESPEYDLQRVVLQLLPSYPANEIPTEGGRVRDDVRAEVMESTATAETVARRIGADEGDVRDALDAQAEATGHVRRQDVEGQTRYWKRGK